ncbi:hypothetical protein DFH07DRAFT_862138 [Mycena maculata]|uniref:Uncharacterized protein n=1 Tax=Mycena maculata TaxID=230809 RepID=A0AAD7HAS8_9AGAR|nr:hypothetical protein DFH07DRAFT_862138 [Mycena maculata]
MLRYGALSINIPVIVFSFVTISTKSCTTYTFAHQMLMLIIELVVSAVMILRVYALYSRSARVLWCLLGIGCCLIGVTIWSVLQGQAGFPITVLPGCHRGIVHSASRDLAVPWECLFVFDSMIFGMTVYNAYVTRRGLGRQVMPLHALMVRDGSLYFAASALANLSNIVTFLIGGALIPGSLADFAIGVSVTMMSRLMLNLHEQTEYGILSEINLTVTGVQDDLQFV